MRLFTARTTVYPYTSQFTTGKELTWSGDIESQKCQ